MTHEPPSRQHIFHSTNPVELHNSQILHDLGIEQSGRMLRVAIDYRSRSDFTLTPTQGVMIDDACSEMLRNVRLGLQRNWKPKITDEFEGSGGVYFLRSAKGSYEAVFKPHDEEQGMPCNPKDHVGAGKEGLREHFLPGQGCLRELAAYLMDHQNFCKVPPTTLVHCEHQGFHYPAPAGSKVDRGDPYPKLGSLQKFIHGAELFEDVGQGLLSDFEVQKIALLDMRILNCDRNAANILVKYVPGKTDHGSFHSDEVTFLPHDESQSYSSDESPNSSPVTSRKQLDSSNKSPYELYPIDHGYAMPSQLKIFEWDWAWLYYPQVAREVVPEIVTYLDSLNIDELLEKLEPQVPLSDESKFLLRLSHYLIVEGVRAGLTLKDIALFIARSDEDVPSKLELFIEEAEENAYRSIELKSSSRAKSPVLSSILSSSTHSSPRSTADMIPVKQQNTNEAASTKGNNTTNCLSNSIEGTSSRHVGNGHNNARLGSGSSDDHTTQESDSCSSTSDRTSPTAMRENCHAIDLSPMRPHLSSSSSWNSFTSFHAPQPSLHNYAVKQSCDNSLGMSPRRKDAPVSMYLPPTGKTKVVKSPNKLMTSTLVSGSVQGVSLFANEGSVLSEEKLGTIIEYARERGLSSLSNCSTASHDSEQIATERISVASQDVNQTCFSTPPVLSATASGVSVIGASSDVSKRNSDDDLKGIVIDFDTSSDFDEQKHMSLPGNALRRMNAISGPDGIYAPSIKSDKVTGISISSDQTSSLHISEMSSIDLKDGENDPVNAVRVDFGPPPLMRAQASIDSSLGPMLYNGGGRTWTTDVPSPQVSMAKAALMGSYYSKGGTLSPSYRHASSLRNTASPAGSVTGSLDDQSSDYGYFNSDVMPSPTISEDSRLPLSYGEFSGIDISTKEEGDGDGETDFDELCAPLTLTRVVSFSGFESAPVYDNLFAGKMGNLRLERRKAIAKTKEFMQLRLQFAIDHIFSSLIHRIKRDKENGSFEE